MKRFQNNSFMAGTLAGICYLVSAFLAFSRYPLSYSPMQNWLSDLGNVVINSRGAVFYNTGIITTALLLMVFFLGLSRWKIENKRIQITMLFLAQIFGILGSSCMIMSAIFPINALEMHRVWSMALYFMLATAFVFLAAALRYHRMVPRWLLILGISTGVMVNLTVFLPTTYLLEWVTVALFLSYVTLVGLETRRLVQSC
jgi:hypothetical membrane protein